MAKTDKRERILAAACQLFLTKGLNSTKMIDIAKEAGIGKGTIYQYFSSKDILFETLFEQEILTAYRGMGETLAQQVTAKAKLMAYISFDSSLTKSLQFSREVIYDIMMDSMNHHGTTLAKRCIEELMEYRFTTLYEIIKEGIEKGEFAKLDPLMATSTVMGALAFYLTFNYNFCLEHTPALFSNKEPWQDKDFLRILLGGLCSDS